MGNRRSVMMKLRSPMRPTRIPTDAFSLGDSQLLPWDLKPAPLPVVQSTQGGICVVIRE